MLYRVGEDFKFALEFHTHATAQEVGDRSQFACVDQARDLRELRPLGLDDEEGFLHPRAAA